MSPDVRGQIQRIFGEGTLTGLTDAQLLDRFVTGRDEAAFSALVSRHGPMVLGVCRGVVRDEHDAEDAFQATFLVLARKAGSLRVDDSLGGWLHRVGRRIAVETNRRKTRRWKLERGGLPIETIAATRPDPTRDSLLPALHEEIDRLPAKYRVPIVLCDLQSMTRDEAASRLGWPAGTVAGRVARGRALLRDRLTRRGLLGAAGALAMPRELSAAVSSQGAESITKGALEFVSRTPTAAGTVSASAVSLAEGVLAMMFRTSVLKASLLLIPLTAVTGALAFAALAEPDAKQTITGNVVGPSGKAAEGVRVFYSQHEAGKSWGDVLVEVMPDPDGQIRLETPPVTGNRSYRQMGMLWAYRPGALVGTMPVFQGTNPPGVPTPLAVGPPAYTPFEVRDPQGKPVAGATIEPKGVETPGAVVPERLAELIGEETVTDANGRAVMTAFLAEEVTSVVVTAPGYGRQIFYFGFRNITTGVKVLALLPMTRLKGRLTGDPALIGGRELSITVANPARGGTWATSLEQTTTDAEGRFEVDGLVPGYLGVSNERDINSPFYFQTEPGVMIEEGKTKEIELAPKKAVKLSGVVREKGTEKPIPGVGLVVAGPGVGTVTTDAEGRYTGFDSRQTQHLLTVVELPEGFAPPLFVRANLKFPLNAEEIEMPPIDLAPATSVDGVVVDPAGKPIAGADVTVFWEVDEGENRRGPTQSTVRSGLDGRFTVKRVDLGGDATLVAHHLGLRTPQAVHIKIGTKEPIRLQLDDSRSVALEGRVVDSSGKPIAGAQVHLRRAVDFRKQGAKFTIVKDELVDFGGNIILKTDADGHYQTPKQLDRESTYSAFATTPGMVSANTDWMSAGAAVFPDITLKPEKGKEQE